MSEEKKWYCLRVISNKERIIKERLDKEIEIGGWQHIVTQVIVPTEKIYKIRNGKKVVSERNLLPGYLLVEMDPKYAASEISTTLQGVKDVMHFLGRNNPTPMKMAEVNRILGTMDELTEEGAETLIEPFIVGETVKVIDGPFNEFVGDVIEVSDEKKKLKVLVKIFGRGTEVELNYVQVEKQM